MDPHLNHRRISHPPHPTPLLPLLLLSPPPPQFLQASPPPKIHQAPPPPHVPRTPPGPRVRHAGRTTRDRAQSCSTEARPGVADQGREEDGAQGFSGLRSDAIEYRVCWQRTTATAAAGGSASR